MEYSQLLQLSRLKLGKYVEYLVCAKLVAYHLDVYLPALDDHGVDMIVRKGDGRHYDIQVKAKRALAGPITFSLTFAPSETLFVVLAPFVNETAEPTLYLVPSMEWSNPSHPLFKKPTQNAGYQFDFNRGYQRILEPYTFDRAVQHYLMSTPAAPSPP
jgi:hypothetical protein